MSITSSTATTRSRRSIRATILRLLGFQLHAERHAARPAAGTPHRHQDALPLLLVDVRALQHIAGLLFEQFVKGQVADADRVDVAGRSYLSFERRCPRP